MKTIKTLCLSLVLLCCSQLVSSQCLQAGWYQDVNPNHVPSFHDTTHVTGSWVINSWTWSFGDGTSSSLQNPTHVYNAGGTYTVCEIVNSTYAGQYTCSDTECHQVTVDCINVTGDFTFTSGTNGTVSFDANFSSNYPPIDYVWNFGDGSTGSGDPIYHVYNVPGAYNVCVTATDANGCAKTVCHSVGITSGVCGAIHANMTATTSGSATTLQSTSTGTTNNSLYQWYVDGNAVTNPNPNTAYTLVNLSPGLHTFCLYVYANANTFCDSACTSHTISCGISAAFQHSTAGNPVTFYPVSNPAGSHGSWNFGDGTSTTDSGNVVHTFPASSSAVTYHVCHYVEMSGAACLDSMCESITIPGTTTNPCGNAVASFSMTQSGSGVVLQSTSTGVVSTTLYQWWMDGQAITNPNPNTAYTITAVSSGSHTFCLYIYANANTFCDSACRTETLTQCNVYAGFQAVVNGQSVIFYANSNPTGAHSYWTFGDGVTVSDTGAVVDHVFPSSAHAEVYHVCHYVYMPGTSCIDSFCQSITIPAATATCGSAQFTVTQSSGHLVLTSTSTGVTSNTYYLWRIRNSSGATVQTGNGTPFTTSTLQNGTYTVCLYLYMSNTSVACDSECHAVTVTSSSLCSGLSAQWTNTYNSNNSVHFVPANQMTGAVYHWSFGDGQISTAADPTHSYANSGSYTVCLVVEVPGTVCRDSSCHTIQASAGTTCVLPAEINSTLNSNGSYTLTVTFNGSIVAGYAWSTGAHTQDIVVTSPGVYCVTVEDINGCRGTDCDTIGTNTCNLNAGFQYTVSGGVVTFYPAPNNGLAIPHGYWNFGDGTTSNDTGVIHHTFPSNPNTVTYTVCHYIVIPNSNCTASYCQQVTVPGTGTHCGTASFTSTVSNNVITATSNSTGVTNTSHYYWNIYDANGNLIQTKSGLDNFIVSGSLNAGAYTVCLFLYGNTSSQFCDSVCHTVNITSGNPCSNLSAAWTSTMLGTGGIQFHPSSTLSGVTHYWSFGDGTTSNNVDPVHSYTTSGNYTVCHYVEIPGAHCMDSSCHTVTATGANPCAGFSVNINPSTSNTGAHGLEAVVTGGGATHYYHWSNSATTAAIFPTAAGNYCVTVYDNNQCTATACANFTPVNTNNCQAHYSYNFVNCNTVHFVNTSSGSFTSQTWYFGDGTSSSSYDPTHTFGPGTWTVQLTVYTNGGNCQATYYQVITIQPCGGNDDTICGTIFIDLNGNGVQDSGEQGYNGGTIYASNSTSTHPDANGHYILIVPAGTYTVYFCAPTGYTFTIPVGTVNPNSQGTCASYTVTTNGTHNCGYNFGIQNNTVTICGTVYFDANNNHQQDANTESGIANAEVHITAANGTSYTAHTDQNGHYCVTVPAGTYTITLSSSVYSGGTVTPQTITLTTTSGTNYYHNDFGVYTQPGSCDLGINITPHTTVTAGFPAWYDIEVCNIGASVASGTLNLFFDPALNFSHASPAQTSVNNSTYTVTWNIANLLPGHCEHYWANFVTDSNTAVGQHVFMLANINSNGCNESNYTNNVDTVHQEATASWDPNNKLVLPTGVGAEGRIDANQELTYTINFQNTGNAYAVNVVLHDMLDDDLDIETFRMIGASHPYTMQFNGREAIWKFNAIMLPDSTTNEPGSHGYVTFAIKPMGGVADETKITNTADIYFDYNSAVGTNTTLNTIDFKLSVDEVAAGNTVITLMPNPFTEFTTIKIEGNPASYELKVYDVLGKLIRRDVSTNNTFSIQRETLASGVYMYEVLNKGKVVGKGKMIAE